MTAFSHQLFIEQAWEQKSSLEINSDLKSTVQEILSELCQGKLRVAEKMDNGWLISG